MCKDHELQHYAIDLRNLAREITCGEPELASVLLDMATHDGLASFWLTYELYCEDNRRAQVERLLKRSTTQRRHKALTNAGEIVNRWDIELEDAVPY